MEPLEIAVAVLAVPFLTKAWEKTGEKCGEKLFEQGETLLQRLRGKSPETVTAIERVREAPLDFGQAVLEVEAVAKADPEIAEAVQAMEVTVKEDIQLAQAMEKVISLFCHFPNSRNNKSARLTRRIKGLVLID